MPTYSKYDKAQFFLKFQFLGLNRAQKINMKSAKEDSL